MTILDAAGKATVDGEGVVSPPDSARESHARVDEPRGAEEGGDSQTWGEDAEEGEDLEAIEGEPQDVLGGHGPESSVEDEELEETADTLSSPGVTSELEDWAGEDSDDEEPGDEEDSVLASFDELSQAEPWQDPEEEPPEGGAPDPAAELRYPASPKERAEITDRGSEGLKDGAGETSTVDGAKPEGEAVTNPDGKAETTEEGLPQGGSEIAVNLGSNEIGGSVTIAGEINYSELAGDDRDGFLRVAREEWIRLHPFFVPSRSCAAFSGQDLERRLLVVVGKEHAGKRATALHLASKLDYLSTEHSEVVIYRPPANHRQLSLHELLTRKDSPKKTLFIFEDIFDLGISPIEVKSFGSLELKLEEQQSFLIMTTELSVGDLPEDVARLAFSAQLAPIELFELLRRTLEEGELWDRLPNAEQVRDWLHEQWDVFSMVLDSPFKIERFSRRLIDHTSGGRELVREDLWSLAQQAADPGPWLLKKWSRELHSNDRLLAFLVLFFPSLDRASLLDLYRHSVEWLRESGATWLHDPRQDGLEDILRRIQATTRNDLIQIEEAHYQRETFALAMSHQLLLRSLVEVLLGRFGLLRGSSGWQLRQGLGGLLGALGTEHRAWLLEVLGGLAGHDSWQLRTVASYSIGPMVELDLERRTQKTFEVLRRWSKEPNLNHQWTLGAALWQAYRQLMENISLRNLEHAQRMKERILRMLRGLMSAKYWSRLLSQDVRAIARGSGLGPAAAEDFQQRILAKWRENCSLFPLQHILSADSTSIAPVLARWMADEEVRDLSILALRELLKRPARRHLPALPTLIDGLLRSTAATDVIQIFKGLRAWLWREDLRSDLIQALLEVAYQGTDSVRDRLAFALAWSWRSQPLELSTASDVVARLVALDGRSIVFPADHRGLLVLDPAGLGDRRYLRLARSLNHLLASYLEVRVGMIGESDLTPSGPQGMRPLVGEVEGGLWSRPRLLLPMLEASRPWTPKVTLILATSEPLDLAALSLLEDCGPIVLVTWGAWGDALEASLPNVRWVRLSSPTRETTGPVLSRALYEVLAGGTAERLPSDGLIVGDELLEVGTSPKRIEARLDTAATEGVLQTGRLGRDDSLAHLSAFAAQWFRHDPHAAAELLHSWLEAVRAEEAAEPRPTSPSLFPQGVVARTVLRSLAHDSLRHLNEDSRPIRERLSELMLELLRIEPESWGWFQEILERWVASPPWIDLLLEPDGSQATRLNALIQTIPADKLPRFRQRIRSATAEISERALSSLMPLLESRESNAALPTLTAHQAHGLLFLSPTVPLRDPTEVAFRWAEHPRVASQSERVVVSFFELGASQPFWRQGLRPRRRKFRKRPALLLPALEALEREGRPVDWVLVLTSSPVLDLGELGEPPWLGRVRVVDPREHTGSKVKIEELVARLVGQLDP